jgi:hypothetical protein
MKRRSSMRAAMSALRTRLGPGVQVTSGRTDIFVYVTTGDAAIWAAHAAREVLAQHGVSAGFRLERWDPVGEAWQDATAEPRDEAAAALRDAREYLMEQERQRSAATGRAAWQVRVEFPLPDDAKALARRLVAEGWPIVRRRKYLIAGADCEDDASDLAREIRGYTAIDAVIRVQRGVYGLPWWAQPGGPVGPPMLSARAHRDPTSPCSPLRPWSTTLRPPEEPSDAARPITSEAAQPGSCQEAASPSPATRPRRCHGA